MRILAFCGPKSSGKDTAATYLLARNSLLNEKLFEQMNFADPLKSAVQSIFGVTYKELNEMPFKEQLLDRWPYLIPREVLQNMAKQMRTFYGPDVFARRWGERIKQATAACVVCTDLRHLEELDLMEQLGATIIYVENARVEKEMVDGRANGDPLWSDVSESHYALLKARAHRIIPNDRGINDLHEMCDKAVKETLGDWTMWGTKPPTIATSDVHETLARAPG